MGLSGAELFVTRFQGGCQRKLERVVEELGRLSATFRYFCDPAVLRLQP